LHEGQVVRPTWWDDPLVPREYKADADWLAKRSGVLSCLGIGFAVLAAGAVFAYLYPPANGTWMNLTLGLLVLLAPLASRFPLTRQRLLISAVVWMVLGLPGGYVFGTPVFLAGVALCTAVILAAGRTGFRPLTE
jgi:hypothetical protein